MNTFQDFALHRIAPAAQHCKSHPVLEVNSRDINRIAAPMLGNFGTRLIVPGPARISRRHAQRCNAAAHFANRRFYRTGHPLFKSLRSGAIDRRRVAQQDTGHRSDAHRLCNTASAYAAWDALDPFAAYCAVSANRPCPTGHCCRRVPRRNPFQEFLRHSGAFLGAQ